MSRIAKECELAGHRQGAAQICIGDCQQGLPELALHLCIGHSDTAGSVSFLYAHQFRHVWGRLIDMYIPTTTHYSPSHLLLRAAFFAL